jgi:hypothetical protein
MAIGVAATDWAGFRRDAVGRLNCSDAPPPNGIFTLKFLVAEWIDRKLFVLGDDLDLALRSNLANRQAKSNSGVIALSGEAFDELLDSFLSRCSARERFLPNRDLVGAPDDEFHDLEIQQKIRPGQMSLVR